MSFSSREKVLQVIASDGKANKSFDPDLSKTSLEKIYRAMVLTRTLDTRAMNLQRQGRIGFYVPCSGQEASQIGSAISLRPDDWTFPTYRDLGVAMIREVPTRKIVAHLFGNSNDSQLGRQMPSHWGYKPTNFVSVASPIAAQLPVAVGVAMAMKMKKQDTVVLAYHGDGATSSGEFHVAYNFAGVNRAPIVFICENNGWAISLPVAKQTAVASLADKAVAYGFNGLRVDGNDVLAVYRATRDAVAAARNGKGPTMIECLTYRMGPHSTSDDPTRYRTKEEIEAWKQRDPIERFRNYLELRGIWNRDFETETKLFAERDVNEAVQEEEKATRPRERTMFQDVFAREPWFLKEEAESVEMRGE